MGDRANVVLEESGKRIFLYTHWGGSELPSTLQAALRRGKPRWQDPSYLGRIIFSEMIQHAVLSETGFGLSSIPTDNSYPFLVVDLHRQEVYTEDDTRPDFGYPGPPRRWTFEEYCNEDLTNDPRKENP